MTKRWNYTAYLRRFIFRYPIFNYLLLQIVLWMAAYAFLAVLTHLVLLTAGTALHADISLKANIFIATFFGFFTGITTGYIGLLIDKKWNNKALWFILFIRALINLVVFIILISIVRSAIYPYLLKKFFDDSNPATFQQSWDAFFYLALIYTIVAGLVISFINLVNKKYGPGVLLPILFGRYRKPREEERFFLFMDLKSSTTIAETLGHLKYSAFIRDSFMDINAVIPAYNAQVYQYAGDEIVLTWTIDEGSNGLSCIRFFFACETRFEEKSSHYLKRYGQVPEFKAGLHGGKVTAVEVGDIKRDIAYHGDTLNTAARIQSVCNKYNKRFLTSSYVLTNTEIKKQFKTESIGLVELKGKTQPVEIISIDCAIGDD